MSACAGGPHYQQKATEEDVKIAILGTGRMGLALAAAFTAAGHEVVLGSRTEERGMTAAATLGGAATGGTYVTAASDADVVALALTWPDLLEVVAGLPLRGKILVDCSNPETPDGRGLAVGFSTSGAEEIALRAPGAVVVKAFNHVYAEVLDDPAARNGSSVLVCGDDAATKAKVAGLIRDVGFSPADAGPLASARYLEPLAMLMVQLVRVQGWEPARTALGFSGWPGQGR